MYEANPEEPEIIDDWIARVAMRKYVLQNLSQLPSGLWICSIHDNDSNLRERKFAASDWQEDPCDAIKFALHNLYVKKNYSHMAAMKKFKRPPLTHLPRMLSIKCDYDTPEQVFTNAPIVADILTSIKREGYLVHNLFELNHVEYFHGLGRTWTVWRANLRWQDPEDSTMFPLADGSTPLDALKAAYMEAVNDG